MNENELLTEIKQEMKIFRTSSLKVSEKINELQLLKFDDFKNLDMAVLLIKIIETQFFCAQLQADLQCHKEILQMMNEGINENDN
jgi:hypothetical protein